ncbi:hypothetical protein H0E87_006104, partial [Populus deltoides]
MAETTDTFNSNGASVHGIFSRDQCLTELVVDRSAQSYRYYNSRMTVLEKLKDHGYNVADTDQTSLAHSMSSSIPFSKIALTLIASASLFLSAPIRRR